MKNERGDRGDEEKEERGRGRGGKKEEIREEEDIIVINY